ncbi:hypothetical protein BH10PSE16_BH10PSE16_26400 [soil metagenome]
MWDPGRWQQEAAWPIPFTKHMAIWLAARRLHQGHFVWPTPGAAERLSLSRAQLDALVLGLPWPRIGEAGIITIT